VVVGAEANLVGALGLAVRELQQLDGGPVVRRLDLRFLFDDTVASWREKVFIVRSDAISGGLQSNE